MPTSDFVYFVVHTVVGVLGLAVLVHCSYLSRWGRFFVGIGFVVYGTFGLLNGAQLLHLISTKIRVMPWSEIETPPLVYAAASVEWISLFIQFVFAAVGAGLIVNAITAEKPTVDKASFHLSSPPNRTRKKRRRLAAH